MAHHIHPISDENGRWKDAVVARAALMLADGSAAVFRARAAYPQLGAPISRFGDGQCWHVTVLLSKSALGAETIFSHFGISPEAFDGDLCGKEQYKGFWFFTLQRPFRFGSPVSSTSAPIADGDDVDVVFAYTPTDRGFLLLAIRKTPGDE